MKLTTPEKIRTLQRKLYVKAKREPRFRFYALYDKICRTDILDHAYELVRSNGGAPGVDGKTFKAVEAEEGREEFVLDLQKQLKDKTYRADAVRRVNIPKPQGGVRSLGIPTIRDRVAQMAAKMVIEPIFEADFCDSSYGFRPKRSAHDAVEAVRNALWSGYDQVIDADLSKYFDTIPHANLLATVAERISDGAVLALVKQWLKAPVIEENDKGKSRNAGGGKSNTRGTPQGGVISPLLSNLYLHLLDRTWERRRLNELYRTRLVRYADDLVILCAKEVDEPMAKLRKILKKLDLRLNEAKTGIVNAREETFDFLGFSFMMRRSHKSDKIYPHVKPSKKSVQRIKGKTRELTARPLTMLPMSYIIGQLNMTLRGWSNYFHWGNSTGVMSKVKWYVEGKVRTHLRKRHKLSSKAKAHRIFTAEVIYGRYGLYKLPTTAKWKKTAHART